MKKILKRIGIALLIFILLITSGIIFVFHSPYTQLKELWVTTAMTTLSHQYLARIFVSDKEIEEIMNKNKVIQPTEKVNIKHISTNFKVEQKDRCLLDEKPKHDNTIELIDVQGDSYNGKLMIIHDPSRVFLGTTNQFGEFGQKLLDMTESYDAIGGINAGGFADEGGHGTGGHPGGLVVSEGKLLQSPSANVVSLVGLTEDNVLVIGNYNMKEIEEMKIRDAVEFSPALIINGKPTEIIGNGGWGIQPRTAIGQRKDGSILFLIIDGRQISSVGVSIKELQDLMIKYGAENATNLDGGSSTTIVYKDEILNKPCSRYGPRYLPNGFLIKKDFEEVKTETVDKQKNIKTINNNKKEAE